VSDRSGVARAAVTVVIPVLDEGPHLGRCLESVTAQTYHPIAEILVVDGGSTDDTVAVAEQVPGVRVLPNPRRVQSAAMNVALHAAQGDLIVRVDGRCELPEDYVGRCVAALDATGAAMVGGRMEPHAEGRWPVGIAAAMSSPVGVGPARFHHGGTAGWVDTVYLGAFRRADALAVGGYDETFAINEDAEFAHRLATRGGVWFDPSIAVGYVPRSSFPRLARQFFRYGLGRAATVRKHPRSLAPRQLAAPALVLGLLSRRRLAVAALDLAGVAVAAADQWRRDRTAAPGFAVSLPVMHLSWGSGFLVGLVTGRRP
jgi:succinoglycan biosynthesis protein ExoA